MMSELHLPWLELSVLIPLVGAIAVIFIRDADRARRFTIAVSTLALLGTLGEWFDFATLKTFEAHDHWDIFRLLFHRDVFIVDELSAPLLPLGALLYLAVVLTTLRTKASRFSFSGTLFSEAILLATLACRSPWSIILLLTVSIIPPWLELRRRNACPRVFVFHMGLSTALLVLGQLLTGNLEASNSPPLIGGCLLTAGALIRCGVFPLHCWITDLFEKATFGTALLFITPMTGAYAVMRLVFPIAPAWALQSIALVSLLTALYSAGMALVQKDTRRFFCYLFLSHSSLVLVGLELVTPVGLTGGLCVWLSVGISLLGFGIALRSVEARQGRLELDTFHGLFTHTPFLAGMFLITGLSSIGFPGTVGFIGTELLVEGAIEVYPIVGLAVVAAAALNSVAVVRAYFHVFNGTEHRASVSLRCRPSERITILILTALIFGGGLIPQPGVASRHHAAEELLRHRLTTPTALTPEQRAADSHLTLTPTNERHNSRKDSPVE